MTDGSSQLWRLSTTTFLAHRCRGAGAVHPIKTPRFPVRIPWAVQCVTTGSHSALSQVVVFPAGWHASSMEYGMPWLTTSQVDQFVEEGFLRIDDAFPRAIADA